MLSAAQTLPPLFFQSESGLLILATGSLVTELCLGLSFNASPFMLSGVILTPKYIIKKKIKAHLLLGILRVCSSLKHVYSETTYTMKYID